MASTKVNFLFSLIICTIFCAGVVKSITGGTEASENQIRYAARIQSRSFPSDDVCSGAIIDDRHILSESKCIYKIEYYSGFLGRDSRITAILGSADLDQPEEMYEVEIEKIIQHPDAKYKFTTGLAILRTADKIVFSDAVGPIALPKHNVTNENGLSVLISGWGVTNKNLSEVQDSGKIRFLPKKLHYLTTVTVGPEECRDYYMTGNNRLQIDWIGFSNPIDEQYFADKFCTLNLRGVGIFRSDEGAPVVKDNVLIGLGRNYAVPDLGLPQIHTNVYVHMDWIQREVNNVSD